MPGARWPAVLGGLEEAGLRLVVVFDDARKLAALVEQNCAAVAMRNTGPGAACVIGRAAGGVAEAAGSRSSALEIGGATGVRAGVVADHAKELPAIEVGYLSSICVLCAHVLSVFVERDHACVAMRSADPPNSTRTRSPSSP